MRIYTVKITGKTSLLMHRDDFDWSDKMTKWQDDPVNKKLSKAGDDRTPAWRWVGYTYHDEKAIVIPSDNIMTCLMQAGANVNVPGGKRGKTFKSQTQSGMMSQDPYWPLLVNGAPIAWADVTSLMSEANFTNHIELVRELGFDLLVKRVKIGKNKHIRVRPLFQPGWQSVGNLQVWDDQIDRQALQLILNHAGDYKGLCDWRPGASTPGPYGTFKAEIIGERQE